MLSGWPRFVEAAPEVVQRGQVLALKLECDGRTETLVMSENTLRILSERIHRILDEREARRALVVQLPARRGARTPRQKAEKHK